MCDEYDVVMAQAEKDCEAIIAQWQKEGISSPPVHPAFGCEWESLLRYRHTPLHSPVGKVCWIDLQRWRR